MAESDDRGDNTARALLDYVREDIRAMETRLTDQLGKLVTQDAFARERERVDAKLAELGSDIVEEKTARIQAITELDQKAKAAKEAADKAHNERVRTKAAWKQAIVVGLILALAGGLVTLAVALVQSAAHLN